MGLKEYHRKRKFGHTREPKGNYGGGTVMVWDNGSYIERGSESRKDSEGQDLDR